MKKKVLFVLCLLSGLMFINSGLNKIFNYLPVPPDLPENMVRLMAAFKEISWLLPMVAAAEIVGGALFITNKYRALGALMLFPVNIGIFLTHIINAPSGIAIAIVFMAINLWVIYENREKYMPMIR